MKRPAPILAAAIAAAVFGLHAVARAADADRLDEIRQHCLQRASVIKSVHYALTEIGTRPLEGTIEYRKVDPKAVIINPDKDDTVRVELVRTRQGEQDAYEVTDYPVDGAKPTGQMRRTWDGESGKMLDVLGHTGEIETKYPGIHQCIPEEFGIECFGRPLTEWLDRTAASLHLVDRGTEIELSFPVSPYTEMHYVLDPSHGFLAKSYTCVSRGKLFSTGTVIEFRKDMVEGVAVFTPSVYKTAAYIPTVGRTDKAVVPIDLTEVKLTTLEFNIHPDPKVFDLAFPDDTAVYDPVLERFIPAKGGDALPLPVTRAKALGITTLAKADAASPARTSLEQAIDNQAAEFAPILHTTVASGAPHTGVAGNRMLTPLLWIASASLAGVALLSVLGRSLRRDRVR